MSETTNLTQADSLFMGLMSQDRQIRQHARERLVAMGKVATSVLLTALIDPSDQVRWQAAKVLDHQFMSTRRDMPHKHLPEFVITDYIAEMLILAILKRGEKEKVVGIGQYDVINDTSHMAEVALP